MRSCPGRMRATYSARLTFSSLSAAGGAGKAQQRQQPLAIAGVLAQAFLEHAAELAPELLVLLRLVLGQLGQHLEHPARERAAHGLDLAVLLQQLARHVQRQIVRIDHALDETQIQRQELLGVVHDEHAPHVQLQAACRLALPQVERRARRHVQQAGVFALALDAIVAPGQRIGAVVGDVPVEIAVFLVGDLAARTGPQRLRLVDVLVLERRRALLLHAHRKGDVIGVAAHQRAQPDSGRRTPWRPPSGAGSRWCRARRA